ncbi:hypothetical protein G9A89_022848 [Geosiphon pyriformis]|nr:hypothetical protein G9A89_022848 [Geosiphon pyriformis]
MNSSPNFVPTYYLSQISNIYPSHLQEVQIARYKKLIKAFQEKYNLPPTFIARSPGRVNLIGEHIDYAGFGVLPMAISRDLLIAVNCDEIASNINEESFVEIANVQNIKYPDRKWKFEGKEVVKIEEGIVEWGNYFKCGYKGILQHLQLYNPKGMRCLIDSDIPAGGGLSSSAAFTCSAALATSYANSAQLTKIKLAEIAACCERFIGLGSGNMDQTASICSLLDHALYIQFLPITIATPTKFPPTQPSLAFVIANSLVAADKVATAPINYNLRVVETKIAAYHLGQQLFGKECKNLRETLDLFSGSTEVTIEQLAMLSTQIELLFKKKKDGYTLSELGTLLKLEESEIVKRFMSKYPIRTDTFDLYKRAKHVIEESSRVLQFYEACSTGNVENSDQLFEKLGELMNQSHSSCRDLYNCSCKELDELVNICLASGAKGSRLTGAGWGGCTVSLVPLPSVPNFIQKVREKYYSPHFPNLSELELQDVIFATTPGSGAAIVDLSVMKNNSDIKD